MPPDSDAPGNEPNLELPGFGFGRKKKRDKAGDEPAEATPSAREQADEPQAPAPARAPAAPTAATPTAARPPARPPARPAARPAARPPSRPAGATVPTASAPPVPPEAPPVVEPSPTEPPVAQVSEDEPTQVFDRPTVTDENADPLDTAAAALDAEPASGRDRRGERAESRARRRATKADRERARSATPLALPRIKPLYAAIITGALSGLAAVLLAIGASRGCEAVRDTSSCGGAGGLLALVAILALEVAIGATLLKAWQIADPASTSFLGVGIVATIAMLVFLDQLDSPWMLLVIPLMTALAFTLSWWVTVSFIDEHPMPSEVDAERGEAAHAEQDDSAQEQDSTT
jgi:hypothetical protein